MQFFLMDTPGGRLSGEMQFTLMDTPGGRRSEDHHLRVEDGTLGHGHCIDRSMGGGSDRNLSLRSVIAPNAR
eukprot:3927167-Amphidinium_carterae.1